MPNWKLKTEENGTLVVQDGRPVYVDEATGQEAALDVNQLHGKVLQLTKEAKDRRLEAESLSTRLTDLRSKFEGVEDLDSFVAEAKTALDRVKDLDAEKLLDSGKVDRIKADMTAAFDEKAKKAAAKYEALMKEREEALARKDSHIRQLIVGSKFATCDLFSGVDPKTTLPAAIAESYFGKHFRVEEKDSNVRVVAYDHAGEVIQSRERPGEEASFEEAIQILFDRFPDRDKLLRAQGGSGSGSTGGTTPTRPKDELEALKAQLPKATTARERIALTRRISALQNARKAK